MAEQTKEPGVRRGAHLPFPGPKVGCYPINLSFVRRKRSVKNSKLLSNVKEKTFEFQTRTREPDGVDRQRFSRLKSAIKITAPHSGGKSTLVGRYILRVIDRKVFRWGRSGRKMVQYRGIERTT